MADAGPIAVIGGRGYLGRALCGSLAQECAPFWVVGRQPVAEGPSGAAYKASVPDVGSSVSGASTVVHMASVTTPALAHGDPHLELENLSFTFSLLRACRAASVDHVVFVSSGGTVYGESDSPIDEDRPLLPISAYGLGKLAAEHALRLFHRETGIPVTVLRVGNAYGGGQVTKGGQGVVSHLARLVTEGKPVSLFGDTVRDYIHVDDVVSAVLSSFRSPAGCRVLNVSTGTGTRLTSLAKSVADFLGRPLALSVADLRPYDVQYNVLKNERARAVLGWAPKVSLSEGLEKATAGFR